MTFKKLHKTVLLFFLASVLFACTAEGAKTIKKKTVKKKSRSVFYLPKPTGDVQEDLDKLLSKKLNRVGRWGVAVMSLEDGSLIYQHNSDSRFIPASNTKLFTTAAALEKLGPDYSYQTEIYACGPIDSFGLLNGDLLIKGSGDPTISDLYILEEWADNIKTMGITEISGDVIGDQGDFIPEKLVSIIPRSANKLVRPKKRLAWRLSGLSFRENVVVVTLKGGKVGKPLTVITDPPMAVNIKNLSRTIAGSYSTVNKKIKNKDGTYTTKTRRVYNNGKAYASFDGTTLKITGKLAAGASKKFTFIAKEPENHFARIFCELLKERGIRISGNARASQEQIPVRENNTSLLYVHYSEPLSEIIKIINKKSHNLYAESLLQTIGAEVDGEGSREKGSSAERDIISQMGLGQVDLFDGCGLSRQNEVSPLQVVNLLKYMHEQPYWDVFYKSLAIGGIDGTLEGRFSQPDFCGRVYAKTGSIGGVSALSGYLTAKNGKMFAFSIMVNNTYRSKLARRVEDYICKLLIDNLS
jgi:D-alanyl-D-alanine carboxypeptidase/D-alanyl-D-alanine-endopeptidase (penicillin-binding protein 4)